MRLNRALLWWYFRTAWPAMWPAALVTIGFVMLYQGLLAQVQILPWLFVFFHSMLVGRMIGRFDSSSAAYLYTRGFSRDRLWAHRVTAHLLCVAVVWLPAGLAVWIGVRSSFQDRVLQNAYYPIFATDDYRPPLIWLLSAVLLVGLAQYGPIRRAQPTRDRDAGDVLAAGVFFAGLVDVVLPGPWFKLVAWVAILFASVVLFWGSWRLHRKVEIVP